MPNQIFKGSNVSVEVKSGKNISLTAHIEGFPPFVTSKCKKKKNSIREKKELFELAASKILLLPSLGIAVL